MEKLILFSIIFLGAAWAASAQSPKLEKYLTSETWVSDIPRLEQEYKEKISAAGQSQKKKLEEEFTALAHIMRSLRFDFKKDNTFVTMLMSTQYDAGQWQLVEDGGITYIYALSTTQGEIPFEVKELTETYLVIQNLVNNEVFLLIAESKKVD